MYAQRNAGWIRKLSMVLFAGALLSAGTASAQDFMGIPLPTIQQGPNGITITVMPGVLPAIQMPDPSFGGQVPGAVEPVPETTPESWALPQVPEAQPSTPGQGGRIFGVFIGITDYPSANDLPFCADDAHRVQRAFLNAGMMAPADSVVLTDSQATRANVGNAIERFHRMGGPSDTVVFFFSGHGGQVADQDGDEADGQDETILLADGAVTDDELRSIMQPGSARDFIALDSCYSGGFAQDVSRLGDSVGFYASREDQVSYVADEYSAGGYLSYYLAQNITRMGGRPIPMWELQRDITADFDQSGVSQRQQLTVGISRSVNTRTVLFDAPQQNSAQLARL